VTKEISTFGHTHKKILSFNNLKDKYYSIIFQILEAPTLLELDVSVSDTCPYQCPTRHRHLWLHWIMSFSQIIIGVDVSVSCPVSVSVSVSVFHSLFYFLWVWPNIISLVTWPFKNISWNSLFINLLYILSKKKNSLYTFSYMSDFKFFLHIIAIIKNPYFCYSVPNWVAIIKYRF
jgi:hypothetical protein